MSFMDASELDRRLPTTTTYCCDSLSNPDYCSMLISRCKPLNVVSYPLRSCIIHHTELTMSVIVFVHSKNNILYSQDLRSKTEKLVPWYFMNSEYFLFERARVFFLSLIWILIAYWNNFSSTKCNDWGGNISPLEARFKWLSGAKSCLWL